MGAILGEEAKTSALVYLQCARLGAGFFNCITSFNSHQDPVWWVSLSHFIDEETRMV